MRREIAFALASICVSGCAPNAQSASLADAVTRCTSGARHVEIAAAGSVVRVLGMRRSRNGLHEGFLVRIGSALVRVEDNADLTGPIPLRAGEAVKLQGQYECSDGVVHWTHHDPSMRHQPGYIDAGGTRYQ